MDQNFAGSQLGEMPPSDAEDDEKSVPREDPNEDQVQISLKMKIIKAKFRFLPTHTRRSSPR